VEMDLTFRGAGYCRFSAGSDRGSTDDAQLNTQVAASQVSPPPPQRPLALLLLPPFFSPPTTLLPTPHRPLSVSAIQHSVDSLLLWNPSHLSGECQNETNGRRPHSRECPGGPAITRSLPYTADTERTSPVSVCTDG
jgi:hypothetical protein